MSSKHTSHLTGCPPCLQPLADLPVEIESFLVDEFNGTIYCQSPSGAFLDASDF
jgi:hypothetical protein